MEEERIKQKIAGRTRGEKCRIYVIRLILNLFVIAVLAGCFYSIYIATNVSQEAQMNNVKVIKYPFVSDSRISILENPFKLRTNHLFFVYFWCYYQWCSKFGPRDPHGYFRGPQGSPEKGESFHFSMIPSISNIMKNNQAHSVELLSVWTNWWPLSKASSM